MSDAMLISPGHLARLNVMLAWFERTRPDRRGTAGSGGGAGQGIVPIGIKRFELAEDLAAGETVLAYPLEATEAADPTLWTVEPDTTAAFNLCDRLSKFTGFGRDLVNGTNGSRGICWKPHDVSTWDILSFDNPYGFVPIELKNDKDAADESVVAYYCRWDPVAGWVTTADADHEITVYDPTLIYRGAARADASNPGSRGAAVFVDGVWLIVWLQPWPTLMNGLLAATLATTDGTVSVDTLKVAAPAGAFDPARGNALMVRNRFAWGGDNNAKCTIAWDDDAEEFFLLQLKCIA